MKIKKYLVFMLCITLSSYLFAQDSIPKLISSLTFSLNVKESILMNNTEKKVQVKDIYIGYKFKNKISIGLNSGFFQKLDYSDNSFENYSFFGVGIKYLIFELENHNKKRISSEPYLNYNYSISSTNNSINDFSYYDIGFNFIYPKAPYCYFGTGIIQNFYNDNRVNLFIWYYSFGLRF